MNEDNMYRDGNPFNGTGNGNGGNSWWTEDPGNGNGNQPHPAPIDSWVKGVFILGIMLIFYFKNKIIRLYENN